MSGPKVRVRLLPADGGPALAEAEFPPEDLPESFEARTTLEIGGKSWEVVKAEPMTRAEYVQSRLLTLVLRRIEVAKVSPKDILFSLPTLNDALPAIAPGSTKLGENVLELHEDDWRQVELVARELGDAVEAELVCVRRILDGRTGPGFKALHVRERLATPLAGRQITPEQIAQALPDALVLDGIAFRDVAGLVEGGFAITSGELHVYGIQRNGAVTTLALRHAPDPVPAPLRALVEQHGLLLVEWCAARIVAGA
jgi:hypothetical protein